MNLKDRSTWEPLDRLRAQWNTARFAGMIRNGFAFHLGEQDKYIAGIQGSPDPATLFATDNSRRYGGQFLEIWDALFRGNNVQDHEMEPFVGQTFDAHTELPALMFTFWSDVLAQNGIEVHGPTG